MTEGPPVSPDSSQFHVTRWHADGTVSLADLPTGHDNTAITWIDLSSFAASTLSIDEILERVASGCPGLDHKMIEDLLTPDSLPGMTDYPTSYGGSLRKVSAFSVEAHSLHEAEERDEFEQPGLVVLQPVEVIAGDAWLVSCWHHRSIYNGIELQGHEHAEGFSACQDAVVKRWSRDAPDRTRTAGDLGIMLLEELALTYAPTTRKLHDWLESWEIGLFVGRRTERRPVAQLWGSNALLRKWLTPLNPPGLRKDINKAWLSGATDQRLCDSLDDRIDRALANGSRLAENLRSSFQMLHSEIEEAGRKAHERNQRQIEILAAVFLVPTLIVGFFGANTWLPGQRGQAGSMTAFVIMSTALVLLTLGTVAYLWSSRRLERAHDQEVEEELAELRHLLGYRV
jgi:hypothetical protein